jgi:hypothetical protein
MIAITVNRVHLGTKLKVHGLFIRRDMNQRTSKVVRIDKGTVTTVRTAGKTNERFVLKTIQSNAPNHILKT